jgi:ADP-ribosylglycohydrolase
VPEALIAFLDSSDYEDAIRLAMSLGGDADTLACIAGVIAEAFHGGVPERIAGFALARLEHNLRSTVMLYAESYVKRTAWQCNDPDGRRRGCG